MRQHLASCALLVLAAAPLLGGTLAYDARPGDGALTFAREGHRLVVANGHEVVASAPAATTERVVIRGTNGRDDTLVIDLSQPVALRGGIDYDGGAGGFDVLELHGGAAQEQRVTQLTPHDGVIDIDGLVIRYSNLEPITDTVPAANFTINGTAGMDTVTISDGPGGTTTISSPTFESVTFANKTNVVFDGLGGEDTVTFNNPTPATGLVSFIVQNVDTVGHNASIRYPAFGVSATDNVLLGLRLNDVDNLEITSQNGRIDFLNANDLTIGGVSPTLAGVRAVNGSLTIHMFGTLTLADTDGAESVMAGSDVTLLAFGDPGNIVAAANNADITSLDGEILLNAVNDIFFGTGGFANSVTGGGGVTFQAVNDVVIGAQAVITGDVLANGSRPLRISNASLAGSVVIDGTVTTDGAGSEVEIIGQGTDGLTINGTVLAQMSNVELIARRLLVNPAATIAAPSGRVVVRPTFDAPHIDLGSTSDASPGALEVSEAEIDRIITPVLSFDIPYGLGAITVTQPISFAGHLILRTPNHVTATGTGSLNAPTLSFDYTANSPRTWTLTPATIQITGGAPVPYSGATTLNANGHDGTFPVSTGGNDTFLVTPSATTTFNVDGNLPTPPASPGDTLGFELAGVVAPVLTASLTPDGYQGTLTSANRQPVNFADIETIVEPIVDLPADLAITKTDNATTRAAGTAVTYTITATNPSQFPAVGVTVTDTFPADLTGVTWTCAPSAGSICAGGGSGNINDVVTLAANGSVTYTANGTIAPSATGTLTNSATITPPATVLDANPANNTATDTTTIAPEADLIVTKSAASGTVSPGGDITYTITLRNSGPSDAQNVVLTDVLPAGTSFVSLSAPPAYGCTTGATVTCSIATLVPSTTADTFTLVVRVATAPAGTVVTNTATATSTTADPSVNAATEPVTITAVPAGIPTLSEWMLMMLAGLLGIVALRAARVFD